MHKQNPTQPDPALKGELNGNCNRTDCQKPGAVFYNHSTRKHYCPRCAELINNMNPESHRKRGHDLCTRVPEGIEATPEAIVKAMGKEATDDHS